MPKEDFYVGILKEENAPCKTDYKCLETLLNLRLYKNGRSS